MSCAAEGAYRKDIRPVLWTAGYENSPSNPDNNACSDKQYYLSSFSSSSLTQNNISKHKTRENTDNNSTKYQPVGDHA